MWNVSYARAVSGWRQQRTAQQHVWYVAAARSATTCDHIQTRSMLCSEQRRLISCRYMHCWCFARTPLTLSGDGEVALSHIEGVGCARRPRQTQVVADGVVAKLSNSILAAGKSRHIALALCKAVADAGALREGCKQGE